MQLRLEPEFRTRLGTLIKRAGSQSAFARLTGISQPLIAYYASGKREPSASAVARIAQVSGVSVDWLLTGKKMPLELRCFTAAIRSYRRGLKLTGIATADAEREARTISLLYQWFTENETEPDHKTLMSIVGTPTR